MDLASQASYTWAKSLDDTSSVSGGLGATGAVVQAYPQDPFNTHPEKGPSTFDVGHAFTLSAVQDLHLEDWGALRSVYPKVTARDGRSWASRRSPAARHLPSTPESSRQALVPTAPIARIRSQYPTFLRRERFGKTTSEWARTTLLTFPSQSISPKEPGPNKGRFGTLGRDTFRGPAFYNYDFAFIKDTPFGKRKSGTELVSMQFRAEFFNIFNIVTMGLPANTLEGAGFGVISKTTGNSRQIQFSLKLIY